MAVFDEEETELEVPRTPPRAEGATCGSERHESCRKAPGSKAHCSASPGEKARKLPIPSPGGSVPELDSLIDQTLREIQELESQEEMWSKPAIRDLEVVDTKHAPLPPVDPPKAPFILRAKKTIGGAEERLERCAAEQKRRGEIRAYLKEACKPVRRPLMPMQVPKVEISDSEMRRPWEASIETLSYNPLKSQIRSQVIW